MTRAFASTNHAAPRSPEPLTFEAGSLAEASVRPAKGGEYVPFPLVDKSHGRADRSGPGRPPLKITPSGGGSDGVIAPIDVNRIKRTPTEITDARKPTAPTLAEEPGRLGCILGSSPAMESVYTLIRRVAPTDATVLVSGESGTGKELVARMVHKLSGRARGPFVPINCGAIPPSLIESELLGHEKGSFTGAVKTHKGYFERAHGGTLFLDEIGEMPMELQCKLLRVLESGVIVRVGGTQEVKVDVRVVAATNRVPDEIVKEGKFRADLFYRLAVVPIELPSLRERGDDVTLLAEAFLAELNAAGGTSKAFAPETMAKLRAHDWPGNVRELKNLVHRAYIMADPKSAQIGLDALPEPMRGDGKPLATELCFGIGTPLAEIERKMIMLTLEHFNGDKRIAAEKLGICLKTLYNRLNSYGAE